MRHVFFFVSKMVLIVFFQTMPFWFVFSKVYRKGEYELPVSAGKAFAIKVTIFPVTNGAFCVAVWV
jgi:hypothetical protein